MQIINAKIRFLHNARPYTSGDEYSNTDFAFPAGALPNTGDIVQLDDTTHPEGAFVVSHRVIEVREGSLCAVTLVLTTESEWLSRNA